MPDIGWTDVTATTAVFSASLKRIGYKPTITVLSVPVAYASLKNKDLDVFLGNWMPAQEADRRPYVKDGSVEVGRANLTGAKYTLAVPTYTYQAGLKSFADIAHFAPQLHAAIYGIEPGNDGNRLVLSMIKQNLFGLGSFRLIESSEQGMLAEVERAVRAHQPIVFLGWDPHPMNMRFDMTLPLRRRCGVRPQLRRGHHLHQHARRLHQGMSQHGTPAEEPGVHHAAGKPRDGRHAQPAPARRGRRRQFPQGEPRHGGRVAAGRDHLRRPAGAGGDARHPPADRRLQPRALARGSQDPGRRHRRGAHRVREDATSGCFFDGISTVIRGSVNGLTALLRAIPSPLLVLGAAVLSWFLRRSLAAGRVRGRRRSCSS